MIRGDLQTARSHPRAIADRHEPRDLPAAAEPFMESMRRAAARAANEDELANRTGGMKRTSRVQEVWMRAIGMFLVGLALCVLPVPVRAQDGTQPAGPRYLGSHLYRTYCAVCHGKSARGDGPLADEMKNRPPELTQFAQRNGGTYPSALVARIVDGRNPLPGHGGPDMPVWGDVFKASRTASDKDVKARIDALVGYLETLQEKRAQ